MLDDSAPAPGTPAAFSRAEEEAKREAFLLKHPLQRMRAISAAVTFAERNLPEGRRRNRPRVPHHV
jgi:hypothetical protein